MPAAIQQSADKILEVISGPMRGAIFTLSLPQTTVGRSQGNTIVIDDPKCSRTHFVIEMSNGLVTIQESSNKNPLMLNGKRVQQSRLKNGDIIQVGNTEIKFRDVASAVQAFSANPRMAQYTAPRPSAPRSMRQQKKGFPFLIVIVVGVLIWIIMSPSKKKEDPYKLKTSSDVAAELDAIQKREEIAQERLRREGKDSRQYLDAQSAFVRGFRDYQNGQFSLANRAFREALAIFPKHELAEQYRQLSEKRVQEYVQNHLREGRMYRERHNYVLCRAAYKKVIDTLGDDKQNAFYKQADAGWRECSSLQYGRF